MLASHTVECMGGKDSNMTKVTLACHVYQQTEANKVIKLDLRGLNMYCQHYTRECLLSDD